MSTNVNSSKKDLFTTNSLAANFLEKFEKLRKHTSNSTSITAPAAASSNVSSIGLSFHKKANDEDLNDDCVVNLTKCKLVALK